MRLLKVTASILVLIATGTAGAATIFLDDFSTDTSANYNVRVVNARANSASPTMTVSDDNVNFTSTNTGITQSVILHNSQTLGVGQTLLVDVVNLGGGNGGASEGFGLALASGLMTGVSLPVSANTDRRGWDEGLITVDFRNQSANVRVRTDGYVPAVGSPPRAQLAGGEQNVVITDVLNTVKGLYIKRIDLNTYDMGWISTSNVYTSVRTPSVDLGENPLIGFYTDTRTNTFSGSLDNLRVIPEPSAAVLIGLAGVGLFTWRRKIAE